MSQSLPYGEIIFKTCVSLEEILNTPDDSDIGYFSEVDLRIPYIIRQKTKKCPLVLEKKIISKDDFKGYMNEIKPKS